jgi:uncharacterized membrane protein/YHS domain-containing protein
MPQEEADSKVTMRYQGETVAFCCDRCMAKFKADPEKYIDRLPQFASVMALSSAPASVANSDDHTKTVQYPGSLDSSARPSGRQGHEYGGGENEAEEGHAPLLGRLHPAIVHFPLAGVPLALLGFLAWIATGNNAFAKADALPLVVGTLAAVVAVLTGTTAHDSMQFSPSMHRIVGQHQIVSTAVMVAALFLTALRAWRWNTLAGRWRWVYGGGLLLTSAMLGLTGYLGGSLVFGPNHLAW